MKKHIYKFLCVGILAMGFASCDWTQNPQINFPKNNY